MFARRQGTAEAVALARQALAKAFGTPGAVPARLQLLGGGRREGQGLQQRLTDRLLMERRGQVPPDPKTQQHPGDHGVLQLESDLLRSGVCEFNAAVMAGAEAIKTIVAALREATAPGELPALPLPRLGLAAGAKTTPHLHGLDPGDGAG